MVTSFILMNVERTKINDVAEQLETIPGISEVYSVSGNFDLIAIGVGGFLSEALDWVFEATIDSARAFLYAASVMLLVRRLARTS